MHRWLPLLLLSGSNVFMTYAWYGHLRDLRGRPLWFAVLASWGIALFEYCLQVPANRLGSATWTLPQLKVTQEVISMAVFGVFCVTYMRQRVTLDFLWASLCLVGAAFFMFRGAAPGP